mgnify:CR=1 FL=1
MDSVVHSVNMPEDRKVAILFGIDRYTSGVPALRNAVRDVQAVAGILRDYHGYATQLFTDEAATLTGLRAALAKVAEQLGESDRLILYFAGHGIAEEPAVDEPGPQIPQGFLVPQDARRDDPASLLPMKEVQQILRGLRCRHMLLFLDCCFAGAFRWGDGTRSLKKSGQRIYKERYERYLRSPAWQVITSAAHDERALDVLAGHVLGERGEVGQNSPFARAVCEGLGKQAAADLAMHLALGQEGVQDGHFGCWRLASQRERLHNDVNCVSQVFCLSKVRRSVCGRGGSCPQQWASLGRVNGPGR